METSKFDIADYLDSNEMIAESLNTVLAEGNDSDVITAIGGQIQINPGSLIKKRM
jgi:DNA-binding phage protein